MYGHIPTYFAVRILPASISLHCRGGEKQSSELAYGMISKCACIIHVPAFTSGTYNVIVVSSYSCTTSRHSSVFPHTALGFRSIACFLFDSTSSIRLMIRAHLEEPLRPLVEGMRLRAHPLSLNNCSSV